MSHISVFPEFEIGQHVLYANPHLHAFKIDTVFSMSVLLTSGGQSLRYELGSGDMVGEDRLCSLQYAFGPHEFIIKWANEWGQMKKEDAKECQATQ